tara:strand:- start:776 stop:1027 length:252 start_codon:yes stop_codon:yes gene_type:complete
MIEIAKTIMEREIKKLEELSKTSSDPLDKSQAQILTDYLKTMVLANKDGREVAKTEALEAMEDGDLQELARQALAVLDKGDKV